MATNKQHLLLVHYNNGYTNAPQCCLLTRILFWYVCGVCEQHASFIYLFLTSVLQPTSTLSKNTETVPELTKYLGTWNQLSQVCICKSKISKIHNTNNMALFQVCNMKLRCLQITSIGFWFYFDPTAVCFCHCAFQMLQLLNRNGASTTRHSRKHMK
jgi:hypothetical protein